MSKEDLRKLVLMRFCGKITRAEVLRYVSDKDLIELEIELYPEYLRLKKA